MSRNYSIDVVKLVFAIVIALGHFDSSTFPIGPIVDLFFLMSGYYLLNSFDSGKYLARGAWGYFTTRVKKIYPYYLFAFICIFLYTNLIADSGISQFIASFNKQLPEVLLIQNVGVFNGGINYPLWQMCTLLIGSFLLFGLLQYNRDLVANVIAPCIALAAYIYVSNTYQSHDVSIWGVKDGFIYVPLLRAIGAMCLGISFSRGIKSLSEKLKSHWSSLSITLLTCIMAVWYIIMVYVSNNTYGGILVFVFLFICLLTNKGLVCRLLGYRVFKHCEKLSLSIYFNHALVINLWKKFLPQYTKLTSVPQVLCFVAVLIIYSALANMLVDCIKNNLYPFLKKISKQKARPAVKETITNT